MTGPDHYRAAERLLDQAADEDEAGRYLNAQAAASMAGVHASLAWAAAAAAVALAGERVPVNAVDWADALAPTPMTTDDADQPEPTGKDHDA